MDEQLVALTNVTTAEVATGLIGILNNPHWIYQSGRRRVDADGTVVEVASGAGRQWTWPAARRIRVDGALEIVGERPLRAGYRAADKPERGRFTDLLLLNFVPEERAWKAGEVLSEFRAVLRCPP